MAITPQTNIRLMKVPFELDNKNQLTFSNINNQTNYFLSLNYIEADNCSYQRKDNIIRFPMHIDKILQYNYVMYQNENYTNKWFYAYISNMRYVNDNMTEITIKTDVFQTWQFDIVYKNMFVEREHVNDDTIGNHTINENLNIGEVIEEKEIEDISLSEYYWVGIMSSWNPATEIQFEGITIYNKNIFGKQLFLIKANPINNLRNLLLFIYKTNADYHIEDIGDIFIIPEALIDESTLSLYEASVGGQDFSFYSLPYTETAKTFTFNVEKQYTFSDFIPKNNKCFIYPYNYLLVSNNVGNYNIFKYENFSNNLNATFEIELALSIGGSGRLLPLNYKKMNKADDEALPLAKYPVCGWSTDAYVNWLTQNAINMPMKIVNTIAGSATNILNASQSKSKSKSLSKITNIADASLNTMNEIASVIDDFYQASVLPNIEGPQNIGDVIFASNRNTFTARCMRAKTEYLKVIDNFFSMYGYKVNELKVPNITGRPNWNYVKTINANIIGNIPQEDLQELKTILDNGVTFWHNSNTFLDYTQNNK